MRPDQLKVVRSFFAQNDSGIDTVVAETFNVFFAASPESAALFKGDPEAFRETFIRMLRNIIDLTRDSHLWPVSAESGHVAIPGFGGLRERHVNMGVTAAHCETMKSAMIQTLEKACLDSFTGEVREAFTVFFDTLTHSLTDARSSGKDSDAEVQSLFDRPQADLLPAFRSHGEAEEDSSSESPAGTRDIRFTDEDIAAILGEADRWPISAVAVKHAVSERTIRAWRRRSGTIQAAGGDRLKQLEAENARLKRLLAERDLEIAVMKEMQELKEPVTKK